MIAHCFHCRYRRWRYRDRRLSKVNRARIVIGGSAQVRKFHQYHFTARNRDVTIRSEAADTIMRGSRDGVVDVDQLIGNKIRIEGDAQQPAFTG